MKNNLMKKFAYSKLKQLGIFYYPTNLPVQRMKHLQQYITNYTALERTSINIITFTTLSAKAVTTVGMNIKLPDQLSKRRGQVVNSSYPAAYFVPS